MLHAWSEYIVYGYSAYWHTAYIYTCAAAVRPAVHIYCTSRFFWIGNTQLPGADPTWARCGIPPNSLSPMRSTLPRHGTCTKVTGSRRPSFLQRNRVRFCCLLRSQSPSQHFPTRVPCSIFCLPVTLSGKEAPPAPRIADCADFFCPILRTGHGCCRSTLQWANADARAILHRLLVPH